MKLSDMINTVTSDSYDLGSKEHILVFNDSSELNYHHLNGLLKVTDQDIGTLSNDKSTGIHLHLGLAADASSGVPFSLPSIELYNRPFGSAKLSNTERDRLPIEEKESMKWLNAAQSSKANLPTSSQLTIIGDRESDIYEYFSRIPDARTHLLVRSCWNRKLANGRLLQTHLARQPIRAIIEVPITGTKKRTARTARLAIRFTPVEILKPAKRKNTLPQDPEKITLYVVEAKELDQTIPEGEKGIHWRLFTTHEVLDLEMALQVIKWYRWRWWIEDFFRILKVKGLQIEEIQFSTGIALKKMIVASLLPALKILIMRQERNGENGYPATLCFTEQQIELLEAIQEQLPANTPKQNNPYPIKSLAWAVFIIARLAGWQPVDLDKRPPGVISIARGLKLFTQQFEGWIAAVNFFNVKNKHPVKKDVCRD